MSNSINILSFTANFSKESAYLLGLLWADGFIYSKKRNNRVCLECVRTDIDIFYPIFLTTGNWHVYYRTRKNRQPQGTIVSSNKILVDFLLSHGFGPHTFNSADSILSLLPDYLKKYWFRGLIDGDGCWYINKRNKAYQFSLSGSYEQDWTYFKNYLKSFDIKYGIQKRIVPNGNKYSMVRITNKKDIIKFGDIIYENYSKDNLGLFRKYNKYLQIKSCPRLKPGPKPKFINQQPLAD